MRCGARLHCTLFDLGRATSRVYGGCGFMISGPQTAVTARRASKYSVTSEMELDDRTRSDLTHALDRLKERAPGQAFSLAIQSLPPQHVGLGTKTSLLLCALSTVAAALEIPMENADLQVMSGRGGTSGVGIHGYFVGGFIADAGHSQDPKGIHGPSSLGSPRLLPSLVTAIEIPLEWRFHLILPKGVRIDGNSERDFFLKNTPIPKPEVHETIAIAYHGLVSGVEQGALDEIEQALNRIHSIGFKARELAAQSDPVRRMYDQLKSSHLGPVGMSSLGPLLYVILDGDKREELDKLRNIAEASGAVYLGGYSGTPRNPRPS